MQSPPTPSRSPPDQPSRSPPDHFVSLAPSMPGPGGSNAARRWSKSRVASSLVASARQLREERALELLAEVAPVLNPCNKTKKLKWTARDLLIVLAGTSDEKEEIVQDFLAGIQQS